MNNTFNFEGKVAFVTGGGSGIGRAAALAFARAGASVAVADIGEQANEETARLIEQEGGRALAVRCDVTKADDVKAALEKTAETFGRLDFAFNMPAWSRRSPLRLRTTTRRSGTGSSTSTFAASSCA
jgi:NAD(P)-dependent dehydrogenase (short-subunit alcohol dehydrogenase family)